MSQVKKMKEKVKFSKLKLRSTTNKSKILNSPRPNEKISSYFSSILNETNSNSKLENDTQNKASNKNNNLPSATCSDNEDDFKESKTQKPKKIFEVKCHKEIKNTKKPSMKNKAVSTFGKNIIVEPGCSDTNQEHLQLAMAMSKSLDEIENPHRNVVDSVESNNYFPSTQEKMAKIKSTLDQFGFKSNKSITDLPLRQKSVRKKFKYITPTLYLRTDEDRAKMIENKVSEIIENIAIYNMNISINCDKDEIDTEIDSNKPKSFMLRDYYNEDAVLFRKNGLSCSEMSQKLFYNGTVAPSAVKAGVLLKDWNSIPGREKTPPLSDTKDNMNSAITENNPLFSSGLNSETLLSENTNDIESNSPTRISLTGNKIPSLKIEKPNIYLSSRSLSLELNGKSECMELTSNIHQLLVTSPINRSISPDLFSDNDSDTETLFNKKNNSPLINNKSNAPSSCQIISSNDSSSFSCDTILLSKKSNVSPELSKNKNVTSPFHEICSNGSSNFSIETKILSAKKKPKTISPLLTKKNSICDFEQEISSINSSDFSHETKLLASTKLNKNNIADNVNKAKNTLNPAEEDSSENSLRFSCETVLLYQNKNYVCPIQDNASNESTFNCETKHLSDQSDDNSVSLLEISPHKNKVKKSPKSPSSCKKNLFESVSLLDFSPHKNKTKKAKKSSNLPHTSIFDDVKPVKSTKNRNDLPVSSKNMKKSPSLENSRIDVSAEDNNIFHFESFCADPNDCFDLTQSSDDSTDIRFNNKTVGKLMQDNEQASNAVLIVPETSDILNAIHSKISKNNLSCSLNNDDELLTVSQLIIENNKHNNDNNAIDLTQSPTESIEIDNKIDTDKIVTRTELQNSKIQRKKSEETDVQNECLATTNKNELHSIFDKNDTSSSDTGDSPTIKTFKQTGREKTENICPISSPSEYCYNKLYNEDINLISFFGHVNRNEISRHESFEYNNADSSKISHIKKELDYNLPKSSNRNNSLLDQTMNAKKSKRKSLRRSFSEKIIRDKEFNYISPKSSKDNSFLKLISPTKNSFYCQSLEKNNSSRSVHKFGDMNELSSKEIKPKCLNKSFDDLVVTDDGLNYSCNENKFNNSNKSFIRFESEKDDVISSHSGNSIEISDEELNYSCNKIGNSISKSASMLLINNLEKQKEDSDDDDVQFLSQSSIDELDEIKNTNRNNVSKLLIVTPPNEKEEENVDDVQFLSQSSIEVCSDISDEELNYSSNTPYKRKKVNQKLNEEEKDIGNVIDRSLNIEANVIDFNDLPCNQYQHSDSLFGSCNNELNSTPIPAEKTPSINDTRRSEVLKHARVADLCTPTSNKVRKSFSQLDDTFDNIVKEHGIFDNIANVNNQENAVAKTPENAKLEDEQIIAQNSAIIVKTSNVTPMPKYNDMDTPQRNKELEKFGLKPLKRAKGVKILQYIYDATHPITGAEKIRVSSSEDEDNRIIKRRRKSTMDENCEAGSSKNTKGKKRKSSNDEIVNDNKINGIIEILGDKIAASESLKDMIFERTFSSRIAWCRLPLHIAWHNFVSSQPDLHEKILLYEPLQIEDIYAKFKSYGLKYHVQDLIAFLDRKCITIRIAQTNRKKKVRKSLKGK